MNSNVLNLQYVNDTSRRISDIYDFFAPHINVLTYLLTYLLTYDKSTNKARATQTPRQESRHTDVYTTMTTFQRDFSQYHKREGAALDVAPPSEGTSPQKHSGMARIVKGFHSFTRALAPLPTNEINRTRLCLPS